MASLTIRNLPDSVRDELRMRAARRGLSMEAEARAILAAAVQSTSPVSSRAAQHALQEWIAANRQSTESDPGGSEYFIRGRRRDAILETIADGQDPGEVFGLNFARILTEAGWTKAYVRKLASNKQ